jgi:hypothetical protein
VDAPTYRPGVIERKVSILTLGLLAGFSLSLAAQTGLPRLNAGEEPHFCSVIVTRPGDNRAPTDAELLDAYNAQARLIHTLHMEAIMRASAAKGYGMGEKPREITISLDFAQPGFLRVTGVIPFISERGFELSSDGREFRLLVPDHGKRVLIVGPVDAPSQQRDQREDLRPQTLIDALGWQEARLRSGAPLEGQPNMRELKVTLPPGRKGPRSASITFDLVHREVESLRVYDATGNLTAETHYSDWQEVGAAPGNPPEGCLPKHLQLLQPDRHYEINLRAYATTLNPQIPQSSFRLEAPAGISTVHLDGAGNVLRH